MVVVVVVVGIVVVVVDDGTVVVVVDDGIVVVVVDDGIVVVVDEVGGTADVVVDDDGDDVAMVGVMTKRSPARTPLKETTRSGPGCKWYFERVFIGVLC